MEVPAKGIAPIAYEPQKLNYQPEIAVGNHIQSVQQKAVTEKYTKAINKGKEHRHEMLPICYYSLNLYSKIY